MIDGDLRKLLSTLEDPVRYELPLGDHRVPLSPLLGRSIRLLYQGEIHCVACGRRTPKSYQQGHCYPCTRRLASCDLCILKPELCHYAQGSCREPEWGERHCLQPHVVYLANSSGLKVGITRHTQIPTRWIDQGASQALPIARASTRRASGLMEQALKAHIGDRTDWRRMLKGAPPEADLHAVRDHLLAQAGQALEDLAGPLAGDRLELLRDAEVVELRYPVLSYPQKVRSLGFDKTPDIQGTLLGIKGQYLILDSGVLNLRKHQGYRLRLETA